MADEIRMRPRRLEYPVFDADNHMYETPEALTQYLPEEYERIVQYVEVGGRTRLAVDNRISHVIPNPTFAKVAPPGAYDDDAAGRERPRSVPSPAAFFDPQPRLDLMAEMGIDRALIWPTLACNVEERLTSDVVALHEVVHAFNRWVDEHWSFDYEHSIYAVPIVTLAIVDRAIDELEWVLARGARAIFLRAGPVPGYTGLRSPALAEFDPFWEAVQDAGVLVGMHVGDNGHQRYLNEWEGTRDREHLPFQGSSAFAEFVGSRERVFTDALASMICHGMLTRFPRVNILPVEWQSGSWARAFVDRLASTYERAPGLFEEDPLLVFRRNVSVHAFRDPDPQGLVERLGSDRCLFGSDFPHPEGLADPLSFVDRIAALPIEDRARVMGGNLDRLLGLGS